jgi:hypothetical protein
MPTEGAGSVEVCTVIPSATLAPLLPMVRPLIVTVNKDDELMEAPEIVKITAATDVALHTAARPETLLAPAAAIGVTFGTKKLEG